MLHIVMCMLHRSIKYENKNELLSAHISFGGK